MKKKFDIGLMASLLLLFGLPALLLIGIWKFLGNEGLLIFMCVVGGFFGLGLFLWACDAALTRVKLWVGYTQAEIDEQKRKDNERPTNYFIWWN